MDGGNHTRATQPRQRAIQMNVVVRKQTYASVTNYVPLNFFILVGWAITIDVNAWMCCDQKNEKGGMDASSNGLTEATTFSLTLLVPNPLVRRY